jgi:hypothetical protein
MIDDEKQIFAILLLFLDQNNFFLSSSMPAHFCRILNEFFVIDNMINLNFYMQHQTLVEHCLI